MKREENSDQQEINGNNSVKPHSKHGGRLMKTKESTKSLTTVNDLEGRFGNSPLRKARYQFMTRYLKDSPFLELLPGVEKLFPSWTREQVEQALDDILYFGDGKIVNTFNDGTVVIESLERDTKVKTMEGSNDE